MINKKQKHSEIKQQNSNTLFFLIKKPLAILRGF